MDVSRGDGLPGLWITLKPHESEAFNNDTFALIYYDSDYRPDLTWDDRLALDVHGCFALLRPQIQRISNQLLNTLSQALEHRVTWDEADTIATDYGPSILWTDCWTIIITSVVSEVNEMIGYGVFGIAYEREQFRAQIWDLTCVQAHILDAHVTMATFRLTAEAHTRIPFDPVHRYGMENYFTQVASENGGNTEPFVLENSDLTLFLSEGLLQCRPAFDVNGMSLTAVMKQAAADYAQCDSEAILRQRCNFGIEDESDA